MTTQPSPSPDTPRTKAGRRMLRVLADAHPEPRENREWERKQVLAIEAEAAESSGSAGGLDVLRRLSVIEHLLTRARLEGWTYRHTSTAILSATAPAADGIDVEEAMAYVRLRAQASRPEGE